jgi:ligand-binding SRPBCC domain-containing protein
MRIYSLKRVQNIPTTLEKAWDFFSSPLNLARITPPELKFETLHRGSDSSARSDTFQSLQPFDRIYSGQLIEYKLSPVPGFRVYWMTEITHVVPGSYFVDEQRRGPFRLWHHQHHFRETTGGVEMTDIVHYQLPLGVFGVLAHGLFVGRQLQRIFTFRRQVVEEIFSKSGPI